ncbi:MAG TPA: deoxyribonuclease IV [Polyangia bacterium]|jgi:deoxyribonuclease-4
MILGANVSTAGGLHLAAERGRSHGCDALQIFTKSGRQWAARALGGAEVAAFKAACRAHRIRVVLAHDSYLINLASPDPALWEKSIAAFADELGRCARLGIRALVTHPGTPLAAGEAFGVDRVAAALDRAYRAAAEPRVRVLLENTAGAGTHLGARFAQLAAIRRACDFRSRIGFCFDTQHAFAAGHDLTTAAGYAACFAAFDREAGLAHLEAFHLNDSRRELGSHLDRHAPIGHGLLGTGSFRRFVNDPRFATVPAVLETPPLPSGEPSFADGLTRLRRLIRP